MNNAENNWAVVFDLDETLVLTTALEALRKTRRWKEVYASFDQTSLPQGTLRFLERIARKAQLGVVTKAPRAYAERLLAHHAIQVPVVVAFHDVSRVKPDPEALLLASKRMGIPPIRCIYVGDDANDVRASQAAGFTPVGVCWGQPIEIGIKPVHASWEGVYEEIMRLIAE
jgi:HAD superfamily hydrolase (TIGR01509 family)